MLTYGQDATTLDVGRDSAITKTVKRSKEKVDLEPFIGDSLNNLNIELLTKMRAQTSSDDMGATGPEPYTYRTIMAKLRGIKYRLYFRGPKIKEIWIEDEVDEFQVKGLHIGDEVDISKYDRIDIPMCGYVIWHIYYYKIPGTEWLFSEDNGKIRFFWRMCSDSSLLVDEVMLENR